MYWRRTEEDFIAPKNVQALIWKEVTADLLVSATLPRWWNVTSNELHAVALYQRAGEDLVTAAVTNQELRGKVIDILSDRLPPQRLGQVEQALQSGDAAASLARVNPGRYLSSGRGVSPEIIPRRPHPGERRAGNWIPSAGNIRPRSTCSVSPGTLAPLIRCWRRTMRCELLNVQPFPAFGGNSSRLLGESWDSTNLYWARLADEKGYSPVMLNRLVPELTRHMVANIFATDIEDWPALTRAMRETGEEFRQGKIVLPQTDGSFLRQPRKMVCSRNSLK